jgi:hypothetical protein
MYWVFLLAAVVFLSLSASSFVRYRRAPVKERLIVAILQLTAGAILAITFFISLSMPRS